MGGDAITLVCKELGLANGAASAWAIDWLGLDSANAIRLGNSMPQPAADQQEEATPGGEDAARAAKVAAIVDACVDPAGAPADIYLRKRAITAVPLPPALRYRPNAHGRYGALVALATAADGTVNAVQQIYVTDDGRKAPVKVQKRTNKALDNWSDTSAVRLPGTPPIILCEGVETALSVWQATRQETWACLGIANIARAPVPEGAAVIVARDGDAPGSKTEIQLRHAVTILHQRGCQVAVATANRQGLQRCARQRRRGCRPSADRRHRQRRALLDRMARRPAPQQRRRAKGDPRQRHPCPAEGPGMAGRAVPQRVRNVHRRPPPAALGATVSSLAGHALVRP
jgi:hypothetical protein